MENPSVPAMCYNGAGIWWVQRVYSPDKLQEGGRVLGHTMVRPRRELELFDLPPVRVAHLGAK